LNAIVDPDNGRTMRFAGFDDSGFSGTDYYRAVSGWHVNSFIRLPQLHQNRSLGRIVNGGGVSSYRGNVALAASTLSADGDDLVPVDALPCDLPKLLQRTAKNEPGCSYVNMELLNDDTDEDFKYEDCKMQ
jgi:hypothetical protein